MATQEEEEFQCGPELPGQHGTNNHKVYYKNVI